MKRLAPSARRAPRSAWGRTPRSAWGRTRRPHQARAAQDYARPSRFIHAPASLSSKQNNSLRKEGSQRRWRVGNTGAGSVNGAGNTDCFCSHAGDTSRQCRPGMSNTLKAGVNLNASNTRKMPPTKASDLYSTFPLNPTRLPVTSDTARQKLSFTAHGQHRGQRPSVTVHPAPDAPRRATDTEL